MNLLHPLHKLYLHLRRAGHPLSLDVRCIVTNTDGHVLLVKHSYTPGWYLPGGGVERGESLHRAILRELNEEVGVKPTAPLNVFGVYWDAKINRNGHIVVFSCDGFQQEDRPNFEIAESGFFDPAQPPPDISSATLRRLIEWRGETMPNGAW